MARRDGALPALADLVLPAACAACGEPDETVCRACRAEVEACLWHGGPRGCAPDPAPAALPPVIAAGRYEGVLATLVAAYKDQGRRDCAGLLAGLLAEAVSAAVAIPAGLVAGLARGEGPVLVVPVPSSRQARRSRGDAPLQRLALGAVRDFHGHELVVADVLRPRRRVRDQAGLGAQARRANLEHALEVRGGWHRPSSATPCLLVDDVVTTGATIVEAARALQAGGLEVVGAAAICATQRRAPHSVSPQAALGKR